MIATTTDRWRRTAVRAMLALVATASAAAGLGCSAVDPAPWQPPEAPAMEGPLAENDTLEAMRLYRLGKDFNGPEDVDVDRLGRIYAATEQGYVLRIDPDSEAVEVWADTGGRPLGMDFAPNGNLIVADAERGLLSIAPTGAVTVMATEADGVPFGFTDDVAVAPDGSIYFSDASSKYGVHEYYSDMLESRPWGRLLRHEPAPGGGPGTTEVLVPELYFANGVAVAPDESFVLVNETWRYRTRRLWLSGPEAGTLETFADNLPGFPDGVSTDGRGTYWVALFTVRNSIADFVHPRPWIKSMLANMPGWMRPGPAAHGFVLALDGDGNVVRSYQDEGGDVYGNVTSVEREGDDLFLGSLKGEAVGRFTLPEGER